MSITACVASSCVVLATCLLHGPPHSRYPPAPITYLSSSPCVSVSLTCPALPPCLSCLPCLCHLSCLSPPVSHTCPALSLPTCYTPGIHSVFLSPPPLSQSPTPAELTFWFPSLLLPLLTSHPCQTNLIQSSNLFLILIILPSPNLSPACLTYEPLPS